ncbi:MAG: hypothetical protein RCO49_07035 [Rickettsia endosymbiont of Argas persicus]
MAGNKKDDFSEFEKNFQPEISSNTKEDNLIEQLKGGSEQAKGFLLEELIKIGTANPNKIISAEDENVKQAIKSLIYADPNSTENKISKGAVLSIYATIEDIKKQIKAKCEKEGYNPKAFERFQEEMEAFPKQLEAVLSTQEGIDSLINERVKNNILKQIPFFKEDGQTGLNAIEKNNVINKLNKYVEVSSDTVSALLQDRGLLNPLIQQITKNASEFFGKEGANIKGVCVLDEKKLTEENILNFTHEINHNIKAFEVIQKGTNNLGVAENQQITETLLPIVSNMSPEKLEQNGTSFVKTVVPLFSQTKPLDEIAKSALSRLDTDYTTKYGTTIVNELQTINKKGVSFWEKIKSVFTGKDYLKERLDNALDAHIGASNKYVQDKITTFSKGLKNNELVAGLKHFIDENKSKNPELNNIEPNKIYNNKTALVKLREINPRRFDQTVFEDSKRLAQQTKVEPPKNIPNHLLNKDKAKILQRG